MFTSGSSGTPKGVGVSQGALAAYVAWAAGAYGIAAGVRLFHLVLDPPDVTYVEAASQW